METENVIKFTKLSSAGKMPKKASRGSAGFDLFAAEEVTVPRMERVRVRTDVAISFSDKYYARLASRSGVAWSEGIIVGAGTSSHQYRRIYPPIRVSSRRRNCTNRISTNAVYWPAWAIVSFNLRSRRSGLQRWNRSSFDQFG